MTKESQKRFEEARERLALALKNLEEIAIEKIKETAIESKMTSADNTDESRLHSKILEQESIIEKLTGEINKIQESLEEMGKESEFTKERNSFFANKFSDFKSHGASLIQAIEDDLIKIQEIIK